MTGIFKGLVDYVSRAASSIGEAAFDVASRNLLGINPLGSSDRHHRGGASSANHAVTTTNANNQEWNREIQETYPLIEAIAETLGVEEVTVLEGLYFGINSGRSLGNVRVNNVCHQLALHALKPDQERIQILHNPEKHSHLQGEELKNLLREIQNKVLHIQWIYIDFKILIRSQLKQLHEEFVERLRSSDTNFSDIEMMIESGQLEEKEKSLLLWTCFGENSFNGGHNSLSDVFTAFTFLNALYPDCIPEESLLINPEKLAEEAISIIEKYSKQEASETEYEEVEVATSKTFDREMEQEVHATDSETEASQVVASSSSAVQTKQITERYREVTLDALQRLGSYGQGNARKILEAYQGSLQEINPLNYNVIIDLRNRVVFIFNGSDRVGYLNYHFEEGEHSWFAEIPRLLGQSDVLEGTGLTYDTEDMLLYPKDLQLNGAFYKQLERFSHFVDEEGLDSQRFYIHYQGKFFLLPNEYEQNTSTAIDSTSSDRIDLSVDREHYKEPNTILRNTYGIYNGEIARGRVFLSPVVNQPGVSTEATLSREPSKASIATRRRRRERGEKMRSGRSSGNETFAASSSSTNSTSTRSIHHSSGASSSVSHTDISSTDSDSSSDESTDSSVSPPIAPMPTIAPAEDETEFVDSFVVHNIGTGGHYYQIQRGKETAKAMDAAQDCFKSMRETTFDILKRTGKLAADFARKDFKLFIYKSGYANYLDKNGKIQRIDYTEWKDNADVDGRDNFFAKLEEFRTLFTEHAPLGMRSDCYYRAGYMADIHAPDISALVPRLKLPNSLVEFCEQHRELIAKESSGGWESGTTLADRIRALYEMDAFHTSMITSIKKELEHMENMMRESPMARGDYQQDKLRLEGFLRGLERERFAANFIRCKQFALGDVDRMSSETRMAKAQELGQEVEEALKQYLPRLENQDAHLELTQEEKDYCALVGSFILQSRVDEFIPYCLANNLPWGNTAIGKNLLFGNSMDLTDEIDYNLFDGLTNVELKEKIRLSTEEHLEKYRIIIEELNSMSGCSDFDRFLEVIKKSPTEASTEAETLATGSTQPAVDSDTSTANVDSTISSEGEGTDDEERGLLDSISSVATHPGDHRSTTRNAETRPLLDDSPVNSHTEDDSSVVTEEGIPYPLSPDPQRRMPTYYQRHVSAPDTASRLFGTHDDEESTSLIISDLSSDEDSFSGQRMLLPRSAALAPRVVPLEREYHRLEAKHSQFSLMSEYSLSAEGSWEARRGEHGPFSEACTMFATQAAVDYLARDWESDATVDQTLVHGAAKALSKRQIQGRNIELHRINNANQLRVVMHPELGRTFTEEGNWSVDDVMDQFSAFHAVPLGGEGEQGFERIVASIRRHLLPQEDTTGSSSSVLERKSFVMTYENYSFMIGLKYRDGETTEVVFYDSHDCTENEESRKKAFVVKWTNEDGMDPLMMLQTYLEGGYQNIGGHENACVVHAIERHS